MSSARLSAVLFACVACACGVGGAPDDDGSTGGNGNGGGGGDGSGSGSGGGGGDGTGPTATEFLAQMDTKFCNQAFMCKANFPTDAGVTFEQAFGASAQACIADSAMYSAGIEQSISSGKVVYKPADAAACLAGITFPACGTFWTEGPNEPAACDTALVGKVADGGACTIDYECSNVQSYCDETTKKCTVDTMQRTVPTADVNYVRTTLRR